ncbi:hypothetical protein IWQ57_004590, partial [Coemansia nantahalensis]
VSDVRKSKVYGHVVTTSASDWPSFIENDYILVDKSIAIRDIMDDECEAALTGLFPRRMGKTAFLRLLQHFLGAVSSVPYEKRLTEFQRYTIFLEHREFFDAHFARYFVIRLDFKVRAVQPASLAGPLHAGPFVPCSSMACIVISQFL